MNDPHIPPLADASAAAAAAGRSTPLERALQALFEPVAELAVARGLPCATAEEVLRRAFVEAASRVHRSLPAHRRVSRIAAATGLSRREVTRLTQVVEGAAPEPTRRPLAGEVFARWVADEAYADGRGRPRRLPRTGAAPSFEALAQSVTKDVHPRTLLDELVRLGLVDLSADGETVFLTREAFVPRADEARMLQLMADNSGDHLRAAVSNVLGREAPHLEQAIAADELSAPSLEAVRSLMAGHWRTMAHQIVPELERLIEEDAQYECPQEHRVRIGLYVYTTTMGEET